MNSRQRGNRVVAVRKAAVCLAGLLIAIAGLSEAAQPDGQYLCNWLIAGPLDDAASFDALVTAVGGADAVHCENEPINGSTETWKRYQGDGNIINFREVAGYGARVTAAAFCEIESDAPKAGHIYCGSQNDLRLWLNGKMAFERRESKYDPLTPAVVDVELKQGRNACLVIGRTTDSELFGLTLRADGPEPTVAPPLIWNPLAPSQPYERNGGYVLLSPDWKFHEGNDPAWASPDFDDHDWQPAPQSGVGLKPGTHYWLRIHAHFTHNSTLALFYFGTIHAHAGVYMDGLPLEEGHGFGPIALWPLYGERFKRLRQDCVLAMHGVSQDPNWHVAQFHMRRADRGLQQYSTLDLPQRYHRQFLTMLLGSLLVFYLFAYWGHPRQKEGLWYCLVLLFAALSIYTLGMEFLAVSISYSTCSRISYGFSVATIVSGIGLSHVLARGFVPWRVLIGYALVAVGLYGAAYETNRIWLVFAVFPLGTLEFTRVWVLYELIPRRPNRAYIGLGIFLFLAGQVSVLLLFFGGNVGKPVVDDTVSFMTGAGPYLHLYGFLGLMACLMIYTAREYAQAMRELETFAGTLEKRVEERTRQVDQLTQQLISAEEAERERIARELHDSVAQTLWSAKMTAEEQAEAVSAAPGTHEMVELLDKAIEEVRGIAYGLRPPELDKLGFVQAISRACKDFSRKTGISLDYQANAVDNIRLSPVAEVNLYRVLQEVLNNVQQHAKALHVRVRLVGAFPSVILRVEDDGRGFDAARQREEPSGSMGLRSIEERVRLIGGTMSIRSAPGEGVRVAFEIPQQGNPA